MALIRVTKGQYTYFSSAFKTLSEGIVLGSLAAFFLPETLQTGKSIDFLRFGVFILGGLLFLTYGAILQKKGVYDKP